MTYVEEIRAALSGMDLHKQEIVLQGLSALANKGFVLFTPEEVENLSRRTLCEKR